MSTSADFAWAIELLGFTKSYRPTWLSRRTVAVDHLTLRLAPGKVLGLLGPNGSGKSTTLKALAGLLRPTTGQCKVFGCIAGSDRARALVGYLPELPRFFLHLTGEEFLTYCAGLSALHGKEANRRVNELVEWSGLGDAARRKLATYSKGMLQRIGLAQAIVHDPALVLLDEPASGLDPEGRIALTALIQDLARRGKAIVFSSHLLAQTAELCDRLALLGRGRLLMEGTPAELLGLERAPAALPSRLEKLYLEKLYEHA